MVLTPRNSIGTYTCLKCYRECQKLIQDILKKLQFKTHSREQLIELPYRIQRYQPIVISNQNIAIYPFPSDRNKLLPESRAVLLVEIGVK